MLTLPNRIESLIEQVEAGEEVLPADIGRIASLQLLDTASLDQRFAETSVKNDSKQAETLFEH